MKIIIIISLILLTGLSLAAYTPEQQTTLDGMRLSFQLGVAYQQAQDGRNIVAYNSLVDQFNTFVIEHFGNDTNLIMSKINGGTAATPMNPMSMPQYLSGVAQRNPFNESTDLSQFGKQEVLTQLTSGTQQNRNVAEANAADWILNTF